MLTIIALIFSHFRLSEVLHIDFSLFTFPFSLNRCEKVAARNFVAILFAQLFKQAHGIV